MATRHFTVEDANALVPWLKEKFSAIMRLREEMAHGAAVLQELMARMRTNGTHPVDETADKQQKDMEKQSEKLSALLGEIVRRGIVVRDPDIGLVDFPSLREGREVHLCWRADEDMVAYWHETTTGYADRKPL
ncbi:MAG: DUF2203 domain-containing protein [Chloroflexi bacterium]|nr:DUF2203 domain-containing protein [Chloroflexota bacterium]